ncbi:MAG: fructosamine kinase family protein [Actinomycetaceae bacterium]|nr:fructosamine kinase family protein [Actinomycetaceae bacterium]
MSISRDGNTYTKTDTSHPHAITVEYLGLKWLAQAQASGGAHVVPVVDSPTGSKRPPTSSLTTVAISRGACTPQAAEQFGRSLACTHAAGADYLGQGPLGWDKSGWMGMAPLSYLTAAQAPTSWGEFYATERLLPYLPRCVDNGSISQAGASTVHRLCERLRDGDFDADQPALVVAQAASRQAQATSPTPAVAARLHGDLWSGNVLWSARSSLDWGCQAAGTGRPGGELADQVGVLIDPAAQGGHAETDLATLGVFGQRHWDLIYRGYQQVSSLAAGWEERVSLHQLHILIVHAYLFAGGYGHETVSVCRKYVA